MMFSSCQMSCAFADAPSRRITPVSRSVPNAWRVPFTIGLLGLLAACGGGGGGGNSVATPTTGIVTTPTTPGAASFPLQAAYKALIQGGSVDNFTVSGDCAGTAQTINGAANAASFQGTTGFSTAQTASLAVPNCSSSVSTSTNTTYFDTHYAPLGSVNGNGAYTVIVGNPLALPASVQVGDSQPTYVAYVSYTDATKTSVLGQVIEGFTIEADTASTASPATTAIYHSTSSSYAGANQLVSTQQAFYRMGTDGSLRLISLDVKYEGTLFAAHLVYTHTP